MAEWLMHLTLNENYDRANRFRRTKYDSRPELRWLEHVTLYQSKLIKSSQDYRKDPSEFESRIVH